MDGSPAVFDRDLVRRHRDRAAGRFAEHHAALIGESAAILLNRIADVKRDFPRILDLGAHHGVMAQGLVQSGRVIIAADLSEGMLRAWPQGLLAVADEELLPFAPESFDLVVSNLSLHWVNDLPGSLVQIRQCMRKDGLFLAAVLGETTLFELRSCLLDAELSLSGGASPRLSPSLTMQSTSGLLQRAGFQLPVTDQESFVLSYSTIFALMHDLRGMGEANAVLGRLKKPTRRGVFELANQLYLERFGLPNGHIPATFDVLFMHGWS